MSSGFILWKRWLCVLHHLHFGHLCSGWLVDLHGLRRRIICTFGGRIVFHLRSRHVRHEWVGVVHHMHSGYICCNWLSFLYKLPSWTICRWWFGFVHTMPRWSLFCREC